MTFKCELPDQGESYVRAFSSGQFFSTIAVLFHKGANAKAFLSGARFAGSRSFAFPGSGFAQILGQNVSISEKTLSNTDLFASRHIKRKRPHFHLTYVPQKLLCLSSLSYVIPLPHPKVNSYQLKNMIRDLFRSLGVLRTSKNLYVLLSVSFLVSFSLTTRIKCLR